MAFLPLIAESWKRFKIGGLNSSGNKLWDKDFGGTNYEDFNWVSQTSDGGYLVSGDSYSYINGDKTEMGNAIELMESADNENVAPDSSPANMMNNII